MTNNSWVQLTQCAYKTILELGNIGTWMMLHMNWSTSRPSSKAGLLKYLTCIIILLLFGCKRWLCLLLTCIQGISTNPFHSWAWDRILGRSTAKENIKMSKLKIFLKKKGWSPGCGGSRGLARGDRSAWKSADTVDSPSLKHYLSFFLCLFMLNSLPFDLFVRGCHLPVNCQ